MERGRPSKYKPEFVDQVKLLAENGATTAEIAEFFEVSSPTIRLWCAQNKDFLSALKAGKKIADDRVERSLYERAVGYSYDALKIMSYEGEVITQPYVEHVPPDTTAAIFWLKNRRPEKWRDRKELTGADGAPLKIQVVRFSDDDQDSQ